MKSARDIRRRLETWEAERAQLFPQAVYGLISLRKIESEVRTALDTGGDPKESSVRQRIEHLRNRPRPDKATAYILDSVIKELRWALGEEQQGALRKVFWDIVVAHLHDAECTMRIEGTDLVLEGWTRAKGPTLPKRPFRLRLGQGKFEDERQIPDPLRVVWILYPADAEDRFVLTAQDDTLSGILRFSGNDYDFQIRDDATGF